MTRTISKVGHNPNRSEFREVVGAMGNIGKGLAFTIIPTAATGAMAYVGFKYLPGLYNKVLLTQWAHIVNDFKIGGIELSGLAVLTTTGYGISSGVNTLKDGIDALKHLHLRK